MAASVASSGGVDRAEQVRQWRKDEERLSADIIEECRVQLMLKFRFLDRALWRMDLEPLWSGMMYPIATDGKIIYHDPHRVIARFQDSFDESIRDYLHLIMHCVFRHIYDTSHKTQEAWSLTCDMMVENVVMELCGERFKSERDAERRAVIDELSLLAGGFLPNRVYEFLKNLVALPSGQQYRGVGRGNMNEWHQLFERDDHAAWPANSTDSDDSDGVDESDMEEMREDDESPDVQSDGLHTETLGSDESGEEESRSSVEGEEASDDDEATESLDESASDTSESMRSLGGDENEQETDLDEGRAEWEDIAKEMEMNLETFSKEWGSEAGSLMASLALANRRTYDYTAFLRKFMSVAEQIKLNQDEFDYTYYMFGMNEYDNMPFIEPLEYKETESIRDFVIVIDTSESVKGQLVQKFLEHTVSILMEAQDRMIDVNIHIIQADSKVQSDTRITDLREVKKMMEGFTIRGFGGTDFRPAFDHVKMLRDRGDLRDMKGLIYFTDGIGQFPEQPPDYDAAFVFVDDGSRELPPVPPWAMKLVIDERDISRLR